MKTQLLNTLKVVILLFFPMLNFAQAPPLGTAANFVLFTSVGAVTNSGIPYLTHLTGNVGTNSAPTITGFGNIDGQVHVVSDPVSSQCTADLLLASNTLLASIPDSTLGVVIGNGTTIRPGIFLMPGAASLNGSLTLNGKGNPNSVFIFKTTLAFSTSANAKIHLINGAKACNVFWSLGGAVSIGAGTFMRGTIISGGAISMGIGDTLEGRALSTAGAIVTSQVLGYTPIGCGSPLLSGPAAPALASTAGYAVFSSIGSVTDDGTSHITGDVGTNSGLTTGYNPLFVTGMIHPSPDASTAACAADLINVYNYLNLHAYDINLLFPAQFGHDLVLTPHTYLLDGATMLTDTVYLNAQGNANAVFIIQINGALSTSTHSKVVLTNGTQSKNVYWKVSGAVNIMDYSDFRGTIVAAGAITFGIGASLDGRAFTTVGAITTTGLTANIPSTSFTEPVDQTACVGGSASFSVVIAATAPTYQWRTGTLNISEGGNISGTTTATLTINPVTAGDAASNYNVLISGSVVPSVNSVSASLTVNPRPVPAITGPATVVVNSVGNIYTTQAGMTGYIWTISSGGVITAGSTGNAITVTWNTAGANSVSVNFLNVNLCTAVSPTVYSVMVNPVLVATITGQNAVCQGATGVVYTTQPGMTGYLWTISSGGIITSGSGTNSILVTWNNLGAQSVGVSYTFASPVSLAVTVSAMPAPTITGASIACQGTTGMIYATQAGMTSYLWTVSSGGVITSGGTGTSSTVTVTWITSGAKTVTVNYTGAGGCSVAAAVSFSVTVNAVPIPTIGSTNNPCTGSTNNIYYTEIGMTGYVWTVSSGGTIVSGQGTGTLNVTWISTGFQEVGVTYANASGCSAISPAVYNLFVTSPPNAAGVITGVASVCAGTSGVAYSIAPIAGVSDYSWIVPPGASIVSGMGTPSILVNYGASSLSGTVIAAGTNQCGNGPSSSFAVTVNPIPSTPESISGPASVCAGTAGVAYNVPAISGASSYVWTVPAGAIITSGAAGNAILVTFGSSAGSGVVTVKGINACGSGAISAGLPVTINAIPNDPIITASGAVLTSSAPSGNQWYYNNTLIPGATGQSYTVTNNTGFYWCMVTVNDCSSGISNKVWIEMVGTPELDAAASFTVYPVPNNGRFTASVSYPTDEIFTIRVYNQLGSNVFELRDVKTTGGKFITLINLDQVTDGIYFIVFANGQNKVVKKFFVKM